MKHERECQLCGEKYSYCPNCADYNDSPRWMFLFHDENCKKIYDVVNAYRTETMSADAAKAKLMKLDLSKRDSFASKFKKIISEIWAKGEVEEKKQNDNKKK